MGALLNRTLNIAKTLLVREYEGGAFQYLFWCQACREIHHFNVHKQAVGGRNWNFDGNLDSPTFSPSLKYTGWEMKDGKPVPAPNQVRCHLFLKNGVLEYCADCPHKFAGLKIPMAPLPDYVKDY